jgi:hypothetical protein
MEHLASRRVETGGELVEQHDLGIVHEAVAVWPSASCPWSTFPLCGSALRHPRTEAPHGAHGLALGRPEFTAKATVCTAVRSGKIGVDLGMYPMRLRTSGGRPRARPKA